MLSKDRYKTTSGFFVIPLLSQFSEEKNYCERRNELSSWRPVALLNRHIHLCLFKLGYDGHALLSSVMYILSGKKITAVYPMSWRRWDQNTTQVANRLDQARATYVRLLHISSMGSSTGYKHKDRARSPIIRPQESLILYRSLNTLCSSPSLLSSAKIEPEFTECTFQTIPSLTNFFPPVFHLQVQAPILVNGEVKGSRSGGSHIGRRVHDLSILYLC